MILREYVSKQVFVAKGYAFTNFLQLRRCFSTNYMLAMIRMAYELSGLSTQMKRARFESDGNEQIAWLSV
jgi:hypothetical protein